MDSTDIRLNSGQLETLLFIAKYRFVTVAQLQRHFNLSSRTSVNKKLGLLVNGGWLGMRYEPAYKFRYRPAAFYATPKALTLLQQSGKAKYITPKLIKASYKDKHATEQFIDDSQAICDIALSLEASYPCMQAFTARQLTIFDYFPQSLPDLYIVHKAADTKRYFLLRFAAHAPSFAHANRIKQLVAYADSGTYDASGNNFPIILAICDTPGIERLVQRTFRRLLNDSDEPMEVFTTSLQAALTRNTDIWSDVAQPDELMSLG